MPKIDFGERILPGLTGRKEADWKEKLKDINSLGITQAALFLEWFDQAQRKKIYRALLDSSLKSIPLCHIRNDMEVEELVFLEAKFKTEYYTIHENSFSFIHKWPGFEKKLYLEMNYDGSVSGNVRVERLGGFCVDLSHFKAAQTDFTKEFEYTYYKNAKANFACNHLNGYDGKKNLDVHTVKNASEFDYLKTLPKFIFGKVIALEMFNGISEQIEYKKYLAGLLGDIFSEKD
jgi:hypothetical protein